MKVRAYYRKLEKQLDTHTGSCSLIGSLLTTILVPMFSSVPGDTIVLASFVPVVMAMTGNVGSQTAMIVT